MTQEALKLAEIIEHFDSNDESLPLELLKEISATLRALAQAQEPVGFAGVKIWIGNQQVVRLLTQTELHHAIEPWLLVELNAEMCIKELKEKNT